MKKKKAMRKILHLWKTMKKVKNKKIPKNRIKKKKVNQKFQNRIQKMKIIKASQKIN